jgi:hypothetical protein
MGPGWWPERELARVAPAAARRCLGPNDRLTKPSPLERQEESPHKASLQLRILRLGFPQDGDVGVGVFPEQLLAETNGQSPAPKQHLHGRSLFQPFNQVEIGQCSTVLVDIGVSAGGDQDRANQVHACCIGWSDASQCAATRHAARRHPAHDECLWGPGWG